MIQCNLPSTLPIIFRSEILSGVLQELENVDTEPIDESKKFYGEMEKFMERLSGSFLEN